VICPRDLPQSTRRGPRDGQGPKCPDRRCPAVERAELKSASPEPFRQMMSAFITTLMGADGDALSGVGHSTVPSERVNSLNSYRHRDFDTRVGTLDVAVPKVLRRICFPDREDGRVANVHALVTVMVSASTSGRVAGGIAAPGSHRSRRDSLPSPGSCRPHPPERRSPGPVGEHARILLRDPLPARLSLLEPPEPPVLSLDPPHQVGIDAVQQSM